MKISPVAILGLALCACTPPPDAPGDDDGAAASVSSPATTPPATAPDATAPAVTDAPKAGSSYTTDSGLTIIVHQVGTGSEAAAGSPVTVHYTGWLLDDAAPERKGEKFDSSRDRGQPFRFSLGRGQVIRGWDEGVAGMRVGGSRTLIIPPDMAYGSRGFPPVIPPSSTLVFDVELLGVE